MIRIKSNAVKKQYKNTTFIISITQECIPMQIHFHDDPRDITHSAYPVNQQMRG